jgi:single-stranded-DNA-specific exonuclease
MNTDVMREKTTRLIARAKKISEVIASCPGTVRIIAHYDCDGITAASIMAKALLKEGKSFRLSFVKQLNEDIIQELGTEENSFIITLDCGSGQLDGIQKHLLTNGCTIVICDHHQVQGEILSDSILHLNPLDFGIAENISAAGVTYLLARALSPHNTEFSELAIVGAIGDAQMGAVGSDWGLFGLNKEILKDSQAAKKIKVMKGLRLWGRNSRPVHKALEYSVDPYIPGISGSESASIQFLNELGIEPKNKNVWRTLSSLSQEEQKKLATGIIVERIRGKMKNPDWIFGDVYELLDKGAFSDANEFATLLNATGKLEKPYLGLGLCLNDKDSFAQIRNVLEGYRKEIGKGISWIEKNKKQRRETDTAHYIHAGTEVSEHIISNVLSIVNRSDILPDKPMFAFVMTDDGKIKVSSRASDQHVEKGVNLGEIVAEAATHVHGEGGGHRGAAGATIPKGKEENFIKFVENRLILSTQPAHEEPQEMISTVRREKPVQLDALEHSVETYGRKTEGTGREGKAGKKVERQGLVRYFGA